MHYYCCCNFSSWTVPLIKFSTHGYDVLFNVPADQLIDLQQKSGDSVRIWTREIEEINAFGNEYTKIRFAIRYDDGYNDLEVFLSENLLNDEYLMLGEVR
jgi:hypothetical protein